MQEREDEVLKFRWNKRNRVECEWMNRKDEDFVEDKNVGTNEWKGKECNEEREEKRRGEEMK